MPREHGRILSKIWRDPDFRALSESAQRLYLLLLSQPNVSNAGTLPLQISKWSKGCDSTDDDDIRRSMAELAHRDFAYFDADTEEALIRSYIRNDGVLKQPNIMKNALRCARAIESEYLRLAMAIELRKIGRDDSREVADEIASKATASEDFAKAHERALEYFPNPFETLPEGIQKNGRVSKPLSNPAGRGKGRGESLVSSYSPSKDEKPHAPTKSDAAKTPEQLATTNAYERVGKAFKYVAVLQIAKWAIHDRGEDTKTVEDAIVAIYEMGKPITKQLVGQYLDGHLARPGLRPVEGGMSRADQKVQGWLDIGARLTNHNEPKGIA
ncbi:hypothetical protein [Rhodococcus sp. SJ-2]